MTQLTQPLTLKQIETCFETSLSISKNIKLILDAARNQGITETDQLAYVLATAKHESANFKTLNEKYNGDPVEY